MATNTIVNNDEEKENKKGIIIFISSLVLILALFIGIRSLTNKKIEEPTKDKDITENKEDVTLNDNNYDNYIPTSKSTKVKKTSASNKNDDMLSLVLLGDNVVYVDYDDEYIDEGAYALDTKDGNVSLSIIKTIYLDNQIVDEVDTTIENAEYTIRYLIVNSRGESKEVARTVIIKEAKVVIALNGNAEDHFEYNTSNIVSYDDMGAYASLKDGTSLVLNPTVITDENENTVLEVLSDMKGIYTFNYSVTYGEKDYNIKRKVIVSDTKAPTISTSDNEYLYLIETMSGSTSQKITQNDIKNLFTVSDEDTYTETLEILDINNNLITSIDKTIVGEYVVNFKAIDTSNNEQSKTILIKIVENEAPIFNIDVNADEIDMQQSGEFKYNYTFNINNLSDDFTDINNIILQYAIVTNIDNLDDASWNNISGTSFELTSSYITPNVSSANNYVAVKAIDSNNGENIIIYETPIYNII